MQSVTYSKISPSTGCLIMIYKKYELIAQTKKHHWSLRQVAKFHWVWSILTNVCKTKKKKHGGFRWPFQKISSNYKCLSTTNHLICFLILGWWKWLVNVDESLPENFKCWKSINWSFRSFNLSDSTSHFDIICRTQDHEWHCFFHHKRGENGRIRWALHKHRIRPSSDCHRQHI